MRYALLLPLLMAALPAHAAESKRAVFAGGCFWCMEAEFEGTPGVQSVTSGYTGGQMPRPKYRDVGTGNTGHAEAVEVVYDPEKVSYKQLLDVYWSNVDPVDPSGQFADKGNQYRTEIYVNDEAERELAEASRQAKAAKLHTEIATKISPAVEFFPAEDYHQDYAKKNPVHYNAYKYGSGRVKRLKELNKP